MFVFTILATVIVALCLAPPPVAAQQTTTYRAPRFIGTRNLDLTGIWQTTDSANFDHEPLVFLFLQCAYAAQEKI